MTPRLRPADYQGAASILLAIGGLGASLAAAFCCALPPVLASAGVAGVWTLELQSFLGPHQQGLLWLAVSGVGLSGMLLAWQIRRACTSGLQCRGIGLPGLTLLGLLMSGVLTWLAFNPV